MNNELILQPISAGSRLFNHRLVKIGPNGLFPMVDPSDKIDCEEHIQIRAIGGQTVGGLMTNQEPIMRA